VIVFHRQPSQRLSDFRLVGIVVALIGGVRGLRWSESMAALPFILFNAYSSLLLTGDCKKLPDADQSQKAAMGQSYVAHDTFSGAVTARPWIESHAESAGPNRAVNHILRPPPTTVLGCAKGHM